MEQLSFNVNWSLVSIIVIFPLVFAIGSSFQRREQAIDAIYNIKVSLCDIFYNQKNYSWNTDKNKTNTFKKLHYQNLIKINYEIMALLKKYLISETCNAP